ncbi:hypothetical protein JZU68_10005, partial [bacterium]|nr:hypothetical protein [bacterium]
MVETYTNGAYSNQFNVSKKLIENYYDTYDFINSLTAPIDKTKINYVEKNNYGIKHSSANGLLTGTCIYQLNESNNYTATAIYYDYRGRVIQTRASNHLNGYDIAYNQYNHSGQVTQNLKEHNTPSIATISELYANAYDHAGRLLQTKYKINTAIDTVLLVNNTYDDLGRLIQKKRHYNTDIEEYDYNIRNWTTRMKSGGFEEKLYYNNSAKPLYNGNISSQTWTYDGVEKAYNFEYDYLNRLLKATSKQGTSTQGDGFFNEEFTYDKMGNITTLKRKKDNKLIDNLSMYYYNNNQSNQLQYIDDTGITQGLYNVKEYQNKKASTTEMGYDVNG